MLLMNKELGEAKKPFNEDDFIDKLKEEVIGKFNSNFAQI